jgi:uncharacterized protein
MVIDLNADEPVDFRFDEVLDVATSDLDGGDEFSVLDLRVRGRGVREQPGQVALGGVLDARLRLRCVRCLESFEESIRSRFELILVPEASATETEGERETEEREALLFYGAEGRVELVDVAREQVHLNLPLKPLCRPDCRGLCPTCGADRNRLECACRSEQIDVRLAPLLELKNKLRGT